MTDFFDELERELRRAHRRDIERHARSHRFDRRWLSGLRVAGRGALVALAVLVVLVAVVLAVARTSDVERPALPPPPPRPTAPPAGFGCAPSEFWRAPIVDEPIPQAIASRFAVFRDPRPTGELPRDLPAFVQAKRKYRGAVTLRPRLDTGTRLRVVMLAADVTTAPNHDFCAPPPDPTEPGLCVAVDAPGGANSAVLSPQQGGRYREAMCFTVDDIEDADAWFGLTPKTVFGLAPDGFDRVTFDTPAGTKTLSISQNVFAGEVRQHSPGRSSRSPDDTHVRFAP